MIGYHAGGLPEVVVDKETGVLCPAGQDVCLGGLAYKLLSDPDRLQTMKKASRTNAERFSMERILDRYESSLCQLIHGDQCNEASVSTDATTNRPVAV